MSKSLKAASDKKLVSLYIDGSQEALAELYRRYFGQLKSLVESRYLPTDPGLAEDVVSKVFCSLHENAKRFDPRMELRPWLRTAAIRGALDVIRRRKSRGHSLEDARDNDAGVIHRFDPADYREKPVEQQAILNEQRVSLQEALDDLIPADRQAVETVWFNGMTLREGAVFCDVPYGTFSTRYTRGMRILRNRLTDLNSERDAA